MLDGIRVVELAGVGPVPFAGMLLADLGADVVRVDRLPGQDPYGGPMGNQGPMGRGRRSLAVDLQCDDGRAVLTALLDQADVLVAGFRPGVLERLGLSSDEVRSRHPSLVLARVTGYGADGPLAQRAGHDLTYLAYAGVVGAIGPGAGPPLPPLNLVADFGGGAAMLVVGVLAALIERGRTGQGAVLDVAMADGAAYLATMTRGMLAAGLWRPGRESNLLDGGAPQYRCYRTADDRWVAIAALEPRFWQALLDVLDVDATALGLPHGESGPPLDPATWPVVSARIAAVVATRSRAAWVAAAGHADACLAPVLDWDEAPQEPHHRARGTFVDVGGALVAALPIRRADAAAEVAARPPVAAGTHTTALLTEVGYDAVAIAALRHRGVVG